MRAELRDGRTRYALETALGVSKPLYAKPDTTSVTAARRVEFRDAWEARAFLARFELDPLAQHELRRLHNELRGELVQRALSFSELVEALAGELSTGRFSVTAAEMVSNVGIAIEPPTEEPELRPPPSEIEKQWIKIKVVLDATSEPIPGVELCVRLPDGTDRTLQTRADGIVEVHELNPGVCTASGPLNVGVQRVEDTWHVVGTGAAPIEPEKGERVENPRGGHLAEIDEHKVADGETIDSLARAAGTTWQDLSKFNWGTGNPNQINEHLRDVVGCTKKTADGHNYIFTSSDDPGIVFIPAKWSEAGLATNQEHIVRVRRASAARTMTISYLIGSAAQFTDAYPKYVLESTDGAYRSEKSPQDDLVDGDEYMQLRFTDLLPGKQYRLTCFHAADFDEVVFDDAPYERIIDQQREPAFALEETRFAGMPGAEATDEFEWEAHLIEIDEPIA